MLSATLSFAAWNHQERVLTAIRQQPATHNLTSGVDCSGEHHLQIRAGRNERVQVNHWTARLPEKPSKLTKITAGHLADNLAPRVDVTGKAEREICQSSEIFDFAVLPQGSMGHLVRIGGPADCVTCIVDCDGGSGIATERVQVDESVSVPQSNT